MVRLRYENGPTQVREWSDLGTRIVRLRYENSLTQVQEWFDLGTRMVQLRYENYPTQVRELSNLGTRLGQLRYRTFSLFHQSTQLSARRILDSIDSALRNLTNQLSSQLAEYLIESTQLSENLANQLSSQLAEYLIESTQLSAPRKLNRSRPNSQHPENFNKLVHKNQTSDNLMSSPPRTRHQFHLSIFKPPDYLTISSTRTKLQII